MRVVEAYASLRKLLVDRRRSLGYSQAKVALLMGTTQSAVSDLETGENRTPGLDTLTRWAAAVQVHLNVQVEFDEIVIHSKRIGFSLTAAEQLPPPSASDAGPPP